MNDTNSNNSHNDPQTGDDLAKQALEEAGQDETPTSVNPTASSAPHSTGSDVVEALTALQNVIERNANELDRLKEELQLKRESLKNIFENDTELATAQEQATVLTKQVKERRTQIAGSAQANQLKADASELQERKKEIEEALNNHLLNYYQLTGSKMFDTSDGEQREFTVRASMKGSKKTLKNE